MLRYYEGLQKCVGLYSENGHFSPDEIDQLDALYKTLEQQYKWSSAVKVRQPILVVRYHIYFNTCLLASQPAFTNYVLWKEKPPWWYISLLTVVLQNENMRKMLKRLIYPLIHACMYEFLHQKYKEKLHLGERWIS